MNEGEERTICTSHVERHNLTIRTLDEAVYPAVPGVL